MQGVMVVALSRRHELRVQCAASASHSSAEAASSVLSTSSESWIARVGRANSSTRQCMRVCICVHVCVCVWMCVCVCVHVFTWTGCDAVDAPVEILRLCHVRPQSQSARKVLRRKKHIAEHWMPPHPVIFYDEPKAHIPFVSRLSFSNFGATNRRPNKILQRHVNSKRPNWKLSSGWTLLVEGRGAEKSSARGPNPFLQGTVPECVCVAQGHSWEGDTVPVLCGDWGGGLPSPVHITPVVDLCTEEGYHQGNPNQPTQPATKKPHRTLGAVDWV